MAANDFQRQLARQLQFIENSCREFDAGCKDEAIRVATCLRIVFHDTKASTSLLSHLNSNHITILSASTSGDPRHIIMWSAITKWQGIVGQDNWHGAPLLDTAKSKRFIPCHDWWESEIVFYSISVKFTRRKLVLCAANTDGGAHVDHALDAEYERLIGGMGVKFTVQQTDEVTKLPVGEPTVHDVRATQLGGLRQLGYEVLHSPDLLNLAGRSNGSG
jgi:hypothetical protein